MSSANTIWMVAAWLTVSGCSGNSPAPGRLDDRDRTTASQSVSGGRDTSAGTATPSSADSDRKCVVVLHGKGGRGLPSTMVGDVQYLRPEGNGSGWGGREWRYFPDDRYQQVRASIASVLDDARCGRAVVQGFSNGAAAAAKLYCRGENFAGRVIGYVVDDPVPDAGVIGCRPRADVRVRLYWTGGLAIATDGWSCATQDFTCEGGRTIGIQRYASAVGTSAAPSIHTTHAEYAAPPEVSAWLQNEEQPALR
jgi:pimeloyl-ACP methyl ester carboxylesterase